MHGALELKKSLGTYETGFPYDSKSFHGHFTKCHKLVHNGGSTVLKPKCYKILQNSAQPWLQGTVFQFTKFQVN